LTARERTVAIRGGAVRFRVLEGGRGPDLLWLHSFHDRDAWPPVLERLAARFTVHAPFHPGVRGSEGVEHLDDVVDLALAYDELLGALGLAAAPLVGHAFGGMMAAELAALCPHRASALVLISPLGLWMDDKPQADLVTLPPRDLARALWKDPESDVARRWATLPTSEEENVAAQIEQIQRLSAMGKFVWPIPDKGLARRAHRVSAPTLVVWGEEDAANPVAYAERFAAAIPRARVERRPGGHMLHLEAPDAVAGSVARFLAPTAGAAGR
jgi:pimeloyl-ACP methyl ester carboxylesterase